MRRLIRENQVGLEGRFVIYTTNIPLEIKEISHSLRGNSWLRFPRDIDFLFRLLRLSSLFSLFSLSLSLADFDVTRVGEFEKKKKWALNERTMTRLTLKTLNRKFLERRDIAGIILRLSNVKWDMGERHAFTG